VILVQSSGKQASKLITATYDHTGFIDYLDLFNEAVDNYTTMTVTAGKNLFFGGHNSHTYGVQVHAFRGDKSTQRHALAILLPNQSQKALMPKCQNITSSIGNMPRPQNKRPGSLLRGLVISFSDIFQVLKQ